MATVIIIALVVVVVASVWILKEQSKTIAKYEKELTKKPAKKTVTKAKTTRKTK